MKTSELQEMMDADRKIDRSRLDEEVTRISYLHGKYYNFLMREGAVYKKLDLEFRKLKRRKTEYYLGRSEDDVYLKTPLQLKIQRQDLDIYLESDDEMQEYETRLYLQKSKVDMIQQFITHVINSRGFVIRDLIAFEKFKHGID